VVIDLDGHPEFQRVILTTRHGLALVQSLNLDVDAAEKPADVVDIATGTIPVTPIPEKKARARKPKPAPAV
jgi:hypothetical protein